MSLAALGGAGAWIPTAVPLDPASGAATFVLDAAGEMAALIVRCPKAGTIDRFDFNVSTVTNSPDNGLRASIQGVDAATGLPDGTVLGATSNAFVTYAHTVTTGWKSTNFGEAVTVTRGQLIACVVDIPSFTASDSVAILSVNGNAAGFPYGISATSTKQGGSLPVFALHYADGYAAVSPFLPGASAHADTVAYNVNTGTADEWGLAFSLPVPARLSAVSVVMAVVAGADFEVVVYDSDGSTALATLAHDGDVTVGTGTATYTVPLASAITLAANATYRVTIRPTTTNNVTLRYLPFASLDLLATMDGGTAFYMTSRLNQGGAWTDYNSGTFRRPRISLLLSAFSDSEYAGGVFGG